MKRFDDTSIRQASAKELREASARLEDQIRQTRAVRVRIARELERRQVAEEASPQAQTVSPGFLEADVEIAGKRRRWWGR